MPNGSREDDLRLVSDDVVDIELSNTVRKYMTRWHCTIDSVDA